jgi:hypothetical protein
VLVVREDSMWARTRSCAAERYASQRSMNSTVSVSGFWLTDTINTVSPYIRIMSLIVLQPPLTDDAHSRIRFSNWKKSLATAAQSLCRTLDVCGAYSQVAEDPEWDSHPSNIISTTSAAGITTITIRARPIIAKLTIYTANEKKTAVINLFNYREKQWKEWTAASMALHQAMISSIGALNIATIERLSGHAGIISLSCRQLLAHITVIFGSLHASDVFFIEKHIKEELTSFAGFRDFISRNSLNYDILAKIPHQISEITKIHWLENSLAMPAVRYPHRNMEIHQHQRRYTHVQ